MARDRPSPYAEGGVFRLRDPPGTVARGPVPRERPVDRSMARDRPSPYAEGGRFSTRKPSCYCSAGALGCHTRIRAGFPRDVERFMKSSQVNCSIMGIFNQAIFESAEENTRYYIRFAKS